MADKRDFYEVLGVQKGASDAELKKAYRRMAKENHPDLHPGDAAAEARFKEINEAYEVLSDGDKRAKYDQYGHAGVDPNFGAGGFGGGGFGGGFDGVDLGDLFGSFFGGGSPFGGGGGGTRSNARKGNNVQVSVTLTLEEAAFGCKKEINVTHAAACDTCHGTGCAEGTTAEVCPHCNGSGTVRVQQRTMFGTMASTTTCPNCRGEGKIIHQPCKSCHGAGTVRKNKTISVNIPAGIDDGQAISLRGQGDVGKNGAPNGDLIVAIHVKAHPFLQRRANNIHFECVINFVQATLGAEMEIPTLDGKVKYKIPEGTQSGTIFRLRNKGVPILNDHGRGDQMVTVTVQTPKNLTATQKEALRHFGETLGEGTTPPPQEEAPKQEKGGIFGKKRKK